MGDWYAHISTLHDNCNSLVCNKLFHMVGDRLSLQMARVEEQSKGKKGVFLYLAKDKEYTFIETTEAQRFQIKCAITQRKYSEPISEENINIPPGISSYVDILHVY